MTPDAILFLAIHLIKTAGKPVADIRSNAQEGPTVSLSDSEGIATGTSTGSVDRFLGLPFGTAVRFEPPQPAPSWEGTYDASQYKPACIQKFQYPEEARNRSIRWFNTPGPPAGESEDCLYLNIFTPAGASEGSELKAVMFWIFGGGFSFGTGTLPLYDGTSFARDQDVIVVTLNYRTNVFGFPGSPDKPLAEQNLGFLDQRLALDWVRRNIRAFGGDPDRVTLFGESAGAGGVEVLVTSPPDPLPFAGAIMQSGQGSISLPNRNSANSWQKLADAADCETRNTLACIRALPALELKELVEREKLTFSPIYDGVTYKRTSRVDRRKSTLQHPRIARVPVLIGSNADEGGVFVYGQTNIRGFLAVLLPANIVNVINMVLGGYSNEKSSGPVNKRLAKIVGEFNFGCPAKVIAEESAEVGIPSWRYYFDAAFENTQIFKDSGAYHSSEINLVFGTYPRGGVPYQAKVSKAMQKMWADFAKNPANGPGWAQVPKVSVFGGGVRAGENGNGKPVMTVQNPGNIDRRCFLYKGIYNAATLF